MLGSRLALLSSSYEHTYVDLSILEAFLQVVIDSILGDRRQQGHVRDSRLLLLE